MPDPSLTDALAEAAALAPADETFRDTLEFRHSSFVDAEGNPDSVRLVADTAALVAPLEADAPIRPSETVTFNPSAFTGAMRPAIEPGTTPQIEITVDNVNRAIIRYLDLAAQSRDPLILAYRPYLETALDDGPQMDPVPTYEVVDVKSVLTTVTITAQVKVDLLGAFPVRQYTIPEFPGLAGR